MKAQQLLHIYAMVRTRSLLEYPHCFSLFESTAVISQQMGLLVEKIYVPLAPTSHLITLQFFKHISILHWLYTMI